MWWGRIMGSSAELVPLWRIFGGTINRPRFFSPRKNSTPSPLVLVTTYIMLSPVPRESLVSISVPRDLVAPREFRGYRGAGVALDMVVVRCLACVLRKSFAKAGAVSPDIFSDTPTLSPTSFRCSHPNDPTQSVRTNTMFQLDTLSIACKCPCTLSALFLDS